MDRFEYINELLSFYEQLLTERQKEILQYYYCEDLSITEIAENLEVSRNAVHDSLKKSVKLLEEYEEKLSLNKLYKERMALYNQLSNLNNDQVNEILNKLINMED